MQTSPDGRSNGSGSNRVGECKPIVHVEIVQTPVVICSAQSMR